MKILVTAAEQQELDRALKAYEFIKEKDADIVFRLTGIGAVNACYCVTKEIWNARVEGKPYDLVITFPGRPLAQITSGLPSPSREARSIFSPLPGQVGKTIVGAVL